MKRGQPSQHWELKPAAGRLKWRPESAERVRTISKLLGVNTDKPAELITPTQAKPLLGEDLVNMLAERPNGALKLVPADAQFWARIFGDK
jgi:hypothetical protein